MATKESHYPRKSGAPESQINTHSRDKSDDTNNNGDEHENDNNNSDRENNDIATAAVTAATTTITTIATNRSTKRGAKRPSDSLDSGDSSSNSSDISGDGKNESKTKRNKSSTSSAGAGAGAGSTKIHKNGNKVANVETNNLPLASGIVASATPTTVVVGGTNTNITGTVATASTVQTTAVSIVDPNTTNNSIIASNAPNSNAAPRVEGIDPELLDALARNRERTDDLKLQGEELAATAKQCTERLSKYMCAMGISSIEAVADDGARFTVERVIKNREGAITSKSIEEVIRGRAVPVLNAIRAIESKHSRSLKAASESSASFASSSASSSSSSSSSKTRRRTNAPAAATNQTRAHPNSGSMVPPVIRLALVDELKIAVTKTTESIKIVEPKKPKATKKNATKTSGPGSAQSRTERALAREKRAKTASENRNRTGNDGNRDHGEGGVGNDNDDDGVNAKMEERVVLPRVTRIRAEVIPRNQPAWVNPDCVTLRSTNEAKKEHRKQLAEVKKEFVMITAAIEAGNDASKGATGQSLQEAENAGTSSARGKRADDENSKSGSDASTSSDAGDVTANDAKGVDGGDSRNPRNDDLTGNSNTKSDARENDEDGERKNPAKEGRDDNDSNGGNDADDPESNNKNDNDNSKNNKKKNEKEKKNPGKKSDAPSTPNKDKGKDSQKKGKDKEKDDPKTSEPKTLAKTTLSDGTEAEVVYKKKQKRKAPTKDEIPELIESAVAAVIESGDVVPRKSDDSSSSSRNEATRYWSQGRFRDALLKRVFGLMDDSIQVTESTEIAWKSSSSKRKRSSSGDDDDDGDDGDDGGGYGDDDIDRDNGARNGYSDTEEDPY